MDPVNKKKKRHTKIKKRKLFRKANRKYVMTVRQFTLFSHRYAQPINTKTLQSCIPL